MLLIILFSPAKDFIKNAMTPDKILVVGDRVDDYGIDFSKEIKDKEKINDFENLFEEVDFKEEWSGGKRESDMVTQIIHAKEGFITHWFEIWINEDEGLAVKSMEDKPIAGKLTKIQIKKLKEIVNE